MFRLFFLLLIFSAGPFSGRSQQVSSVKLDSLAVMVRNSKVPTVLLSDSSGANAPAVPASTLDLCLYFSIADFANADSIFIEAAFADDTAKHTEAAFKCVTTGNKYMLVDASHTFPFRHGRAYFEYTVPAAWLRHSLLLTVSGKDMEGLTTNVLTQTFNH